MKKPSTNLLSILALLVLLAIVTYDSIFLNTEIETHLPTVKSSPRQRSSLPWENEIRFQHSIMSNNTSILMAEYHVTLPQPTPGEMHNIRLAAKELAGTVIMPGEIFSQNKSLGPYSGDNGYKEGPIFKGNQIVDSMGGGVCKVASLLYNLAVMSNLPIVERHSHSLTVPYVPPGQDATVFYGIKDLRFINNTGGPIVIWAATIENTLYIALYGVDKPPSVTWRHDISQSIDYWTIYRSNPALPPGTEKIIVSGQDGCLVRSQVVVDHGNGQVEQIMLGESRYNVLPQIIERGP